jgi:hypothetical protein
MCNPVRRRQRYQVSPTSPSTYTYTTANSAYPVLTFPSNATANPTPASAMSQKSTRSTQSPSTPSTAPSAPPAATAPFTSGTKTQSTVSRVTQRSAEASLLRRSRVQAIFLRMRSATTGAKGTVGTTPSTRSRSSCILSLVTSVSRDRGIRRGDHIHSSLRYRIPGVLF